MKRRGNLRGGAPPPEKDNGLAAQLRKVATMTSQWGKGGKAIKAGIEQVPEVLKALMEHIEEGKGDILETQEVRDAWNQFTLSIDSLRGNYYSQRLAKKAADAPASNTESGLINDLNTSFDKIRDKLVLMEPKSNVEAETRLVLAQWTQRVYNLVRPSTAQNDYKMYDARSELVDDASANAAMYTEIVDKKSANLMKESDDTLYKLGNDPGEYQKAVDKWVEAATAIGEKTLKAFKKDAGSGALSTASMRKFLSTKLSWPANTVATLMENLGKSLDTDGFTKAVARTARATFSHGIDTGRVPPTIGEVVVQANVRAGIMDLPPDESQAPAAPVQARDRSQSGGGIRSLGIPDNIGQSDNIDCISKGDEWARDLVEAKALQLSGAGDALPLSQLENPQLENPGVGILVGFDQIRDLDPRAATITPDVEGMGSARGDGVPIYNVYGDGLCGWYSWIMGAQNSLALMTKDARDYVSDAFVRGLWVAVTQLPPKETTTVRGMLERGGIANLAGSAWENLQRLMKGTSTLEDLEERLSQKQGYMLKAIDAAFQGFDNASAPHLKPAWELIVGYPMVVTLLFGHSDTLECLVSYPRNCVDAIRNNILFHYFKTPAITFEKQEIRELYALSKNPPPPPELYDQVTALGKRLAEAKGELARTKRGDEKRAEEIQSEAAILESTVMEMRGDIKKHADSRALTEALPLRARLATAYAAADPAWRDNAKKRDIVAQQTLAIRQLCRFLEGNVAQVEQGFANEAEVIEELSRATDAATSERDLRAFITNQPGCESIQAWTEIEPDIAAPLEELEAARVSGDPAPIAAAMAKLKEANEGYFGGAARCIAKAVKLPNTTQTSRIKLIIAYLAFVTQKVSLDYCISGAVWSRPPGDTSGDTPVELRSAATIADSEGGSDDILGMSILCKELGVYFPGMKALLGATSQSGDTGPTSIPSLREEKDKGIGSIDSYCEAKGDRACSASSGLQGIKDVWTYYDRSLLDKTGARALLDEHLTVLGSADAGASELEVEMLGWLRETYRVHTASWNASLPGDGGSTGTQGFNRTIEDRGYWEPNQTVDTVGVLIPYPILLYLTYASIEKSRAALSNNTGGHYQSIQYTDSHGMFKEVPLDIVSVGRRQGPFAEASTSDEIAALVDSIVSTGPRGIRMGPLYYGYGNAMRLYRLDTLARWQYNEPGAVQGHQGWSPEATYDLTPANQDNWLAPADPIYGAAAVGHRLINDGCMGEPGGISWGDSIGLRLAMSGFTIGEDNLNMQPQQKIVFYIAKCLLEEWRAAIIVKGAVPDYVKKVSDVWIRTLRDGWLAAAKAIKNSAPEIPIAEIMDIQGRKNEVTHAILEGFTAAARSMRPNNTNETWNGELAEANFLPALEFRVRDLAPFRGNVPNGWFTSSSGWEPRWYSDEWLPPENTPDNTSDSQEQIEFFLGDQGPLAKLFGIEAWSKQSPVPPPIAQAPSPTVSPLTTEAERSSQPSEMTASSTSRPEKVPSEDASSGSESDRGEALPELEATSTAPPESLVSGVAGAEGISPPNVQGMSERTENPTAIDKRIKDTSLRRMDEPASDDAAGLSASSKGIPPPTEQKDDPVLSTPVMSSASSNTGTDQGPNDDPVLSTPVMSSASSNTGTDQGPNDDPVLSTPVMSSASSEGIPPPTQQQDDPVLSTPVMSSASSNTGIPPLTQPSIPPSPPEPLQPQQIERDICKPFNLEFDKDRWLQWTAKVVGIVGPGLGEAKTRSEELWNSNVGPQEGVRVPKPGDGYDLPDSLNPDPLSPGNYSNIPMSEETFKIIYIDEKKKAGSEKTLADLEQEAEEAWDGAAVDPTGAEISQQAGEKLQALRAYWTEDQQRIWNNSSRPGLRNNPQMTMFVVRVTQHDVGPSEKGIAQAASKIAACMAEFRFPPKLEGTAKNLVKYAKFARLLGGICINADNDDELQSIPRDQWASRARRALGLDNEEGAFARKRVGVASCQGENGGIIPLGWIGNAKGLNFSDFAPGDFSVAYALQLLGEVADPSYNLLDKQGDSLAGEFDILEKIVAGEARPSEKQQAKAAAIGERIATRLEELAGEDDAAEAEGELSINELATRLRPGIFGNIIRLGLLEKFADNSEFLSEAGLEGGAWMERVKFVRGLIKSDVESLKLEFPDEIDKLFGCGLGDVLDDIYPTKYILLRPTDISNLYDTVKEWAASNRSSKLAVELQKFDILSNLSAMPLQDQASIDTNMEAITRFICLVCYISQGGSHAPMGLQYKLPDETVPTEKNERVIACGELSQVQKIQAFFGIDVNYKVDSLKDYVRGLSTNTADPNSPWQDVADNLGEEELLKRARSAQWNVVDRRLNGRDCDPSKANSTCTEASPFLINPDGTNDAKLTVEVPDYYGMKYEALYDIWKRKYLGLAPGAKAPREWYVNKETGSTTNKDWRPSRLELVQGIEGNAPNADQLARLEILAEMSWWGGAGQTQPVFWKGILGGREQTDPLPDQLPRLWPRLNDVVGPAAEWPSGDGYPRSGTQFESERQPIIPSPPVLSKAAVDYLLTGYSAPIGSLLDRGRTKKPQSASLGVTLDQQARIPGLGEYFDSARSDDCDEMLEVAEGLVSLADQREKFRIEEARILKDEWTVCLVTPDMSKARADRVPNPWALNAEYSPGFKLTTESEGRFFGTTSAASFDGVFWYSLRVTKKLPGVEEPIEWIVFHRWSQIEEIFSKLFIEGNQWAELTALFAGPRRRSGRGSGATSPFPLSLIRDKQQNPKKPYNVSVPDGSGKIPPPPKGDAGNETTVRLEWLALFCDSLTQMRNKPTRGRDATVGLQELAKFLSVPEEFPGEPIAKAAWTPTRIIHELACDWYKKFLIQGGGSNGCGIADDDKKAYYDAATSLFTNDSASWNRPGLLGLRGNMMPGTAQAPDEMRAPQEQKEQQRTNIETVNRIRGALQESLVDGQKRKSKAQLAAEAAEAKQAKEGAPPQDQGPSAFKVPDSASNLGLNELPNVPAAAASAIVTDVTKSLQSKLVYVPPPSLRTTQAGGELEKAAVDSWSEGMYKMLARGTPDFDWTQMAQLGARFYSDYMNYPVCCTKFSEQYQQQFPKGERFKDKTVPRKFCLQVSPSNLPCISREMSAEEAAEQEARETAKVHALYTRLGFQKLVDPKDPDGCLRDPKPPHNCLWETPQGILAEGSRAIQLAALTEDGRRQEARDQEAAVERAEEAGEASQLRQQLDEAEAELEKARITAQEPSEVKIRVIGVNLTPDLPGDPPPGQRLLKEVIVTPGTSLEGWTAAAVQGGLDPLPDASEAPDARSGVEPGNRDIEIPNEEGKMTRLGRLDILPDGKSRLVIGLTAEQLQQEFPRFFEEGMGGGARGGDAEAVALLEERTGSALMGALEGEVQAEKDLVAAEESSEQVDEKARQLDITPPEERALAALPPAPQPKPLPPKPAKALVTLMGEIGEAVSTGRNEISLDEDATRELVRTCNGRQCEIEGLSSPAPAPGSPPQPGDDAARGYECITPYSDNASPKERKASCVEKPGGKYANLQLCVEACAENTVDKQSTGAGGGPRVGKLRGKSGKRRRSQRRGKSRKRHMSMKKRRKHT